MGVFLNTLTADGKYPVEDWENLQLPMQIKLSEKRKTFSQFFFHFWNLHQIWNILKSKMMVIANVFPKIQTVNNFFRPLCENRRFGKPFDSQHLKVFQKLAKSPCENFVHEFPSFWGKLILKMCPLVVHEILDRFVNTLTADRNYDVQDWENLPLPLPMQFSEKPKTFSQFFVLFLESTSNFKHFEKKYDGHS